MKILATGHRGYIGSHLTTILKEAGHDVTGVDIGLFEGCGWEPLTAADRELTRDVRTLTERDLEGHDCVIHLAAISNDPMGDVDPTLTLAVNRDASIRLAEVAKRAGVPRFLFAGSCSVYGQGATLDLDESALMNPLTAYAQSKIEAETAIRGLADDGFAPVFLRNSTAYGHSRMLRIDLVVNNLLASALVTGEIRVMSDGSPWRPLIHCHDIARAFLAFAEAPAELVSGVAVNVGGNEENYQVRDVAAIVGELLPGSEIVFTGEVGADPRNYRVNFDRLGELLPDFRLHYTLRSGMVELLERYRAHGFSVADFEGAQFVRLRSLGARRNLIAA